MVGRSRGALSLLPNASVACAGTREHVALTPDLQADEVAVVDVRRRSTVMLGSPTW
jgi:hypothetical protein